MSETSHTYSLEAEADPMIWERMNVYLHLYLLDEEGNQTGMLNADNRDTSSATSIRLESPEATPRIKICLYVVPRGLPDSRSVSASPPLALTLRVFRGGQLIDTLNRKINPWGGDQLVGLEYAH